MRMLSRLFSMFTRSRHRAPAGGAMGGGRSAGRGGLGGLLRRFIR